MEGQVVRRSGTGDRAAWKVCQGLARDMDRPTAIDSSPIDPPSPDWADDADDLHADLSQRAIAVAAEQSQADQFLADQELCGQYIAVAEETVDAEDATVRAFVDEAAEPHHADCKDDEQAPLEGDTRFVTEADDEYEASYGDAGRFVVSVDEPSVTIKAMTARDPIQRPDAASVEAASVEAAWVDSIDAISSGAFDENSNPVDSATAQASWTRAVSTIATFDSQAAAESDPEQAAAADFEDEVGPGERSGGTGGGWTIPLLCAGIAVVACCMVIPQADANRRLAYQRATLRAQLESVQTQVATNDDFLHKLASDPILAERLAQRQMRMVRVGTRPLPVNQALPGSSPFDLIQVTPPPALPPYEPIGGKIANLCYQPRPRLYVMGGGLLLLAAGLVLGASPIPLTEANP